MVISGLRHEADEMNQDNIAAQMEITAQNIFTSAEWKLEHQQPRSTKQ